MSEERIVNPRTHNEIYRRDYREYRANLTPERLELMAEEARLDVAWQKATSEAKRKKIKTLHSHIVNKLIELCNFIEETKMNRYGPKHRILTVKKHHDELYGEPDFEYKVHLRRGL